MGILVFDNIKNLNTEDFLTFLEENENWKNWSSPLQLNGLNATKIEGRLSVGIETGIQYENTNVYLKNGILIYKIDYNHMVGFNELGDLFDQILSTFKFTD